MSTHALTLTREELMLLRKLLAVARASLAQIDDQFFDAAPPIVVEPGSSELSDLQRFLFTLEGWSFREISKHTVIPRRAWNIC